MSGKSIRSEESPSKGAVSKDSNDDTPQQSPELKSKPTKSRKSIVTEYERRATKISSEDQSEGVVSEDDDWSDDEDEDEDRSVKDKYISFTIDTQKVAIFGLGVAVGYIVFRYVSNE